MKKQSVGHVFMNGLLNENPTFRLLLGMCPTLAISTAASQGIGMGLATTFVLVFSNMVISLLRKVIPERVRIPSFIVVIATFVTIIDLIIKAYLPSMSNSLGIYIPLIVVNCIIFARAEAFAFKNPVLPSIVDGLGMGLGFTCSLTLLSSVREIIGSGKWFGMQIMPAGYRPMSVIISPSGGFLTLGILILIVNAVVKYIEKRKKAKTGEGIA
ncbi:MAG: electron transport complex subunit E [Clostridiales bacterium]|nr:electron transport complex subunit E [Clostridiales bacterium]MDY4009671.1 electron transport complex subunit E [Candidatus Limiplasma sp.]